MLKARQKSEIVIDRAEFKTHANLFIRVPEQEAGKKLKLILSDAAYHETYWLSLDKNELQKFTNAITSINDFYQTL